jgi:hypothetical protein
MDATSVIPCAGVEAFWIESVVVSISICECRTVRLSEGRMVIASESLVDQEFMPGESLDEASTCVSFSFQVYDKARLTYGPHCPL